ncbi:HIT domain-containing protein [soil metagenome]
MLERLWNGWRNAYVTSGGAVGGVAADDVEVGRGSVFTRILASELPDAETHIVHRGDNVFAILNAFPYAPGHLLVLPYREIADLETLTAEETNELWATVTAAVVAIKHAYRPEGINVGVNLGKPAGGSVSDHLHVHVVPRWTGDSNFMTALANTRTIPESLPDSAAKLRTAWPDRP